MKVVGLMAGAALILAGCTGSSDADLPDRPPSTVRFDGTDAVLYVEVAATPDARSQGLMGVQDLPADQGMAFLFEEPVQTDFWMKDTVIPLSIAFVDASGRVIAVRDMQPCEADEACPRYGPDEPFMLAIEANLGWFEDHGVDPGDRAELLVSAYG